MDDREWKTQLRHRQLNLRVAFEAKRREHILLSVDYERVPRWHFFTRFVMRRRAARLVRECNNMARALTKIHNQLVEDPRHRV